MAISRSPSLTSLVSPRPVVTSLWGSLASLFSPRGTPRPVDTDPGTSSLHKDEDSLVLPPSPSPAGRSSQPFLTDSQKHPKASPPIFIARDFAYEPKPEFRRIPVDPRWVVPFELPERELPGLRQRLAEEWEASHSYLYRHGNRADPPNTIPKTWGGRSKGEDDALMQKARERLAAAERARRDALAFGLTPTEPNLEGPPAPPLPEYAERDALARADAYQREQEAHALAAGHPPLVKTPPNSPPPPGRRRRGLPPPSPHPTQAELLQLCPPSQTQPHAPSPPSQPKRKKSEELDSESEMHMTRARRRRHDQKQDEDVCDELQISKRYALRQRPTDGATNASASNLKSSTRRRGKGKGKEPSR